MGNKCDAELAAAGTEKTPTLQPEIHILQNLYHIMCEDGLKFITCLLYSDLKSNMTLMRVEKENDKRARNRQCSASVLRTKATKPRGDHLKLFGKLTHGSTW